MTEGNHTIGKLELGEDEKFDPKAKSPPDMLTTKQTGFIFALAGKAGVNAHKECDEFFGCEIHELSKLGASRLIAHLQKFPPADVSQKNRKTEPAGNAQRDLFSGLENKPESTGTAFAPEGKRAGFADPENPPVASAQEILASGGVRQTSPDMFVVSSLTETGVDEFSVRVSKTGGPKCDCPEFFEKGNERGFKCEHVIAAMLFYKEIGDAMRELKF